jgi:glutamate-1-semialdehyde aminotransferase
MILGHANQSVVAAVEQALHNGFLNKKSIFAAMII